MPASDWFYYLILFAVGLAFGSFLNVLTLRYHPGKKLFASDNYKEVVEVYEQVYQMYVISAEITKHAFRTGGLKKQAPRAQPGFSAVEFFPASAVRPAPFRQAAAR